MEEVYRSARTVVRRVERGGRRVIVKSPAEAVPDARELGRYRREFSLLKDWDAPGVVRVLELREEGGHIELVFEDAGARALSALVPMAPEQALELLVGAAEALDQVHRRGVVHKDVNPSNLVWAPDRGVQLIDFGLSSTLAREEVTTLEGTLQYLAPEQSGRVSRPVDHRSDLYSLGATAWHLLVGRPPFEGDDPLALVHAHLARRPPPPHQLRPEVSPALSQIVMTLLAKDPEERYQSAAALAEDLRRCRSETEPFPLRSGERARAFSIPDKLYGRLPELQRLLDCFHEARQGGCVLALVTGPGGMGKSALVAQLKVPVLTAGGIFVAGRHDLLKQDVPYQAVVAALRAALRHLLAESEARLEAFRTRLGEAAAALAHLVPELKLVSEDLPPVPELSPQEARSRTHLAVSALVRALASPEQPLVLFLDDLQWADASSLELVRFLATDPELEGLLLLVGSREPGLLEGTSLEVGPLALEAVVELVADSCRCDPQTARGLAELLLEKTAGNPFFLRALLMRMSREGVLTPREGAWHWEAAAVKALPVSDNVVDMMVSVLRELPAATVESVRTAACLGHRFELRHLARALEREPAEVARDLWPALERGFLIPLGTDYRLAEFTGQAEYRFNHDRVQEAARQLLTPQEQAALHLRVGRMLLEDSEALFAVVDHLGRGVDLMDDPGERARFASLALEAGRRARSTAAFDNALSLLESAWKALPGDRWESHYELALALAAESAALARVTGRRDLMEERLQELMARARSLEDQIPAYITRLQSLVDEMKPAQALALSEEFLSRLGRRQPRTGNPLAIAWALLQTRRAIGARQPEDLLALPEAGDPLAAAAQTIQTMAAPAQARVRPETIPLGILRDCRSVLRDGVTGSGAQCWTGYGLLLCWVFDQVELGMRYADLALAQVERLGAHEQWPRVALLAHQLIYPWGRPLARVREGFETIHRRGLEVGDTTYAFLAAVSVNVIDFHTGSELSALEPRVQQTSRTMRHHGHAEPLPHQQLRRSLARLLHGRHEPEPDWDFTQDRAAEVLVVAFKLHLALVEGDVPAALALARVDYPGLQIPMLGPAHFLYWTYASVALLEAEHQGLAARGAIAWLLRRGRRGLARWSRHLPDRGWRLAWVKALDLRNRGREPEALEQFDRAIDGARAAGFRHDAALICEQAGRSCTSQRLARAYLQEARAGYQQWGAVAKLEQLESTTTGSSSSSSLELDLETVVRASLALSGEIRLEALLVRLMDLTLENAGAQRGWLVIREGSKWMLSGRAEAGGETVPLSEPLDLEGCDPLPGALLRYTARVRRPVVPERGEFGDDRRSRMCLPLVHGKRLTGLIYLENDLATGVFTAARIEVLRTLSAQMAISIENARHFLKVQAQHEQILAERERRHHQEVRSTSLEARKNALASFLGIASHDLKNPLAAIRIWASRLADGEVRSNIEWACQRATGLIRTYLDAVAAETGADLALNLSECELDQLVEQEIDFQLSGLGPEERAGAALEWDLEPVTAMADPGRLQQVIGNLVGNALKYCPPGTPIAVRLAESAGVARLEVADQGPGVAPERVETLFDAFERGQSGGTGLGLWICRLIVEAHGGRLGVDSRPGEGSRFWVELPVKAPGVPPAAHRPTGSGDRDLSASL